jgi:hypothetical protein
MAGLRRYPLEDVSLGAGATGIHCAATVALQWCESRES